MPPRLCHDVRKLLKRQLLTVSRVRTVIKPEHSSSASHLLVLTRHSATSVTEAKHNEKIASFPPARLELQHAGDAAAVARALSSSLTSITAGDTAAHTFVKGLSANDMETYDVDIKFEHWPLDLALRRLLPTYVIAPTAFETIGHIAHLNLREQHAPYRSAIGLVMLEKLAPRIRSVVNKTEATGGPFRTFRMEVLAGSDDLVAKVRENGCLFTLDFRAVYWNSRLEAEHRRIVDSFREGDIVADAFCGVGPFAVPAARRARCEKIYANDLNPSSVKYLRENIKKNNISDDKIETSCGCAREFLMELVRKRVKFSKVVMNFPSGAPEFLEVFRGLYKDWNLNTSTERKSLIMPTIYCYCFVKGEGDLQSARIRARTALCGNDNENARKILPDAAIHVRVVRDVAPKKVQVCVTVTVPEEIGLWREDIEEPEAKRQRTSEVEEGDIEQTVHIHQ